MTRTVALALGALLAASGCGSSAARRTPEREKTPTPIVRCEPALTSDPFAIDRALLVGNTLEVDVSHEGACKRHDFAACYTDLAESSRDLVEVHLQQNAYSDTCKEPVSESLLFDLLPLAVAYESFYQVSGGVVDTGYGLYGFGALSCEESARVAQAQGADAASKVDSSCGSAGDCTRVSVDTPCNKACPAVVSLVGRTELEPLLETIDEVVCGSGDACSPSEPECDAGGSVACVAGRCVDGN